MLRKQSPSIFDLGIVYFLTVGLLYTAAIQKSHAFSLSSPSPSSVQTQTPTPEQREDVVRKYFDGVNKKDYEQIKSCFTEEAAITDICSLNQSKRMVSSSVLADRCKDFLTAHPDCKVGLCAPPCIEIGG